MVETELLLDEELSELSDGRYKCYRPLGSVNIFGYEITEDDTEYFEISVSSNCSLEDVMPLLNKYLLWLADCKETLVTYFKEQLGEILPENWYEEIEVFTVSIVINSLDDYGATIAFGESIFGDHIVELDLEKEEIVDNRLNG